MSIQLDTSNDRPRTYWTPTMERYFVDLMLEQMHRGNRSGHTFSKQAWTDMLTVFNSKFGSQYDKDILKSRYTNLWKQFNDVQNILGQNGFSWDETRQIVVADDHTWNAYLKVHPDARSYRTKPVLNFSDLCIVYGHTTADGRYSRSSHDLDFEDEVQGLKLGTLWTVFLTVTYFSIERTLGSNDRKRTFWTPPMDRYLIDLLLEQVDRGNRIGKTFITQAWIVMVESFNSKFEAHHDKEVLKNRYKHFRRLHNEITSILKRSGFSWDDRREMIIAEDHAWDSYTKVNIFGRK
ncbi:L10-interacting MYB domain-containing protein [Linum perenne]